MNIYCVKRTKVDAVHPAHGKKPVERGAGCGGIKPSSQGVQILIQLAPIVAPSGKQLLQVNPSLCLTFCKCHSVVW